MDHDFTRAAHHQRVPSRATQGTSLELTTVRGTVSEPAEVTVNGVAAALDGLAFAATVTLPNAGANRIVVGRNRSPAPSESLHVPVPVCDVRCAPRYRTHGWLQMAAPIALEAGAPSTSRSFGVVVLDAALPELELAATPKDHAE